MSRETHAELWYPRNEGRDNVDTIRVSLSDVRAADDLLISYDFDRDGYSIKMATVHEWGVDEEPDPHLVEVAFVPAWVEGDASESPPTDRCDQIVNNGVGEPTECGRTLPCEMHDPESDEAATHLSKYGCNVFHDTRCRWQLGDASESGQPPEASDE